MAGEKVLYLDCSGGVSGDMMLGALVDLGVPFAALTAELDKLRVPGFRLKKARVSRGGVRGAKIDVVVEADAGHRRFADFARILEKSRLARALQERALELIRRLYAAEARVHGKRVDKIHLHELGSLDTLVDVVGSLVGHALLGGPAVESSPINVGGGAVEIEHGLASVPAPATLVLLRGSPVFSDGSDFERTTPTGAVLVTGLADRFGALPAMTVEKVGYGMGAKNPPEGRPNALRAILGERRHRADSTILVVEATLDDMTPEVAGYLMERLFTAGAVDVFFTPVQMKKNRPGVHLTALCTPRDREGLSEILFRESTTLGLRWHEAHREVLERKTLRVKTPWGPVGVKLALANGEVVNVAPEFEDCRRVAQRSKVALKEVQHAAVAAFRRTRAQKR